MPMPRTLDEFLISDWKQAHAAIDRLGQLLIAQGFSASGHALLVQKKDGRYGIYLTLHLHLLRGSQRRPTRRASP